MDDRHGIFIIGVEKCGTTSLFEDLKAMNHNVMRWEWAYCFPNIREFIKKHFPNFRVAVITRDPIERCFSDYQYLKRMHRIPDNMTYEKALKKFPQLAQGSCFEKWVKPGDLTYTMKDLTIQRKQGHYEPITEKEIKLTHAAIERAKNKEYHRSYSEIDWTRYKINI